MMEMDGAARLGMRYVEATAGKVVQVSQAERCGRNQCALDDVSVMIMCLLSCFASFGRDKERPKSVSELTATPPQQSLTPFRIHFYPLPIRQFLLAGISMC